VGAVSEAHERRLDVMLSPSYVEGLSGRTVDELWALHEECLDVETEVSYIRRLAQARIDIIEAELDRRIRGGSVGDLIAMLPEILTDEAPRPSPATSRLSQRLAPSMAIEWRRGLEHLITDTTLLNLPTLPDEELRATLEQLHQLEQEVSERRRALHPVIDLLEIELAQRHKAGQVEPRR
jgi:hypothetical protein